MKRILSCMLLFAMLLAIPAVAVSVTSVEINQTVQSGEDLYVFFHVADENEDSISGLSAENIRVDLGGQTLVTELENLGDAGIGYVFAIDVSSSLSKEQFAGVQGCMKECISAMGSEDQAAIVTFGNEVVTVTDFTDNKNTLEAVINGLSADASGTMLYSGVMKAIDIAKRQSSDLPLQRVVVILSDGLSESSDTASLQEMRSKAIEAGIPLYVTGVRGEDNSEKLAELGEVARATGGKIYTAGKDDLATGFDSLGSYIRSGFIAASKIPAELADGSQRGLILTVTHNGAAVDGSVDIRVKGITESAQAENAEGAGDSAGQSDTTVMGTEEEVSEGAMPDMENSPEDSANANAGDALSEEGEKAAAAGGAAGLGAIAKRYSMFIYIGVGVLLAAGVAVYLVLMHKKRKSTKNGNDIDGGYDGTGGIGGNTETIRTTGGTMPADEDTYATMMGGIIVLTDSEKGRSYSVQKTNRITIGRNSDNDIVIPDGKVSGNHCELTWDGGALYVIDKDSTNGTYLISNGLRYGVDSYSGNEFNIGDELAIGDTRLELTDM